MLEEIINLNEFWDHLRLARDRSNFSYANYVWEQVEADYLRALVGVDAILDHTLEFREDGTIWLNSRISKKLPVKWKRQHGGQLPTAGLDPPRLAVVMIRAGTTTRQDGTRIHHRLWRCDRS